MMVCRAWVCGRGRILVRLRWKEYQIVGNWLAPTKDGEALFLLVDGAQNDGTRCS